ncbi:MAG: hypothetical protein N3C12_04830 [Candidatus Binatia bacterium]|nr:hypothetical protein [Candidatus Binatia bacterium]
MQNLDLESAKLGHKLAGTKVNGKPAGEKLFTNALGVLEEQARYACFLCLQAREGHADALLPSKQRSS